MEEQGKEYFDVESVSQTFARIGEVLATTLNSFINVFKDSVSKVLNSLTPVCLELKEKRISRKRFVKLLMAEGIQRNNAQKIAEKYHNEQGYYCMFDVVVEWRKNG